MSTTELHELNEAEQTVIHAWRAVYAASRKTNVITDDYISDDEQLVLMAYRAGKVKADMTKPEPEEPMPRDEAFELARNARFHNELDSSEMLAMEMIATLAREGFMTRDQVYDNGGTTLYAMFLELRDTVRTAMPRLPIQDFEQMHNRTYKRL